VPVTDEPVITPMDVPIDYEGPIVFPTVHESRYISPAPEPRQVRTPNENALQTELHCELSSRFADYILSLTAPRTTTQIRLWRQQEDRIFNLMCDLGYFHSITHDLTGITALNVNAHYDNSNLSQRFLLKYLHTQVLVYMAEDYLLDFPPGDAAHSVPTGAYNSQHLTFVNVATLVSEATPSNTYLRTYASSDEIDFIVNGQKLRLKVQSMVSNVDRVRYITAINIRVTSERGTHIRYVIQLWNAGTTLCFRRLTMNRPEHGFKFVRRRNTDGIIIKEIQ